DDAIAFAFVEIDHRFHGMAVSEGFPFGIAALRADAAFPKTESFLVEADPRIDDMHMIIIAELGLDILRGNINGRLFPALEFFFCKGNHLHLESLVIFRRQRGHASSLSISATKQVSRDAISLWRLFRKAARPSRSSLLGPTVSHRPGFLAQWRALDHPAA